MGGKRMLGIAIEKVSALIERFEAFDAGLEETDEADDAGSSAGSIALTISTTISNPRTILHIANWWNSSTR